MGLDSAKDHEGTGKNCSLDHWCGGPDALPCMPWSEAPEAPNVPQDDDGNEWSDEDRQLTLQDKVRMVASDGSLFELPMESFIASVKRLTLELDLATVASQLGVDLGGNDTACAYTGCDCAKDDIGI